MTSFFPYIIYSVIALSVEMTDVDSASLSKTTILEATSSWADEVVSSCGSEDLFVSVSAIESSYSGEILPRYPAVSSSILDETPFLLYSSRLFTSPIYSLSTKAQEKVGPSEVDPSEHFNSVFTTNDLLTSVPINENIPMSPQCPDEVGNISVLMQAGIGLCVCFVMGILVLGVMICCKKKRSSRSFSLPVDSILTKPRGPAVLQAEQEPRGRNSITFSRKGPIVLPTDLQIWQRDHMHLKFSPNILKDLESEATECESISFEEITTTL